VPALGLDFERSVAAQALDVRGAILAALGDLGFKVHAQQLTRIEAKRGSRFFGGALMPARMLPIVASFEITPGTTGCRVEAHLVDEHINIAGRAWGWNQSYRDLFAEVAATVDRGLARLDPAAATSFAQPSFWSRGGDVGVLEQVQAKGAQAGSVVFDKANEVLEGGARRRAPTAWKGVDAVAFAGSQGWAVLRLDEAQADLGVAVMISSDVRSLPANLRADVITFAARVEEALSDAAGDAVTIHLEAPEEPVFTFLHSRRRSGSRCRQGPCTSVGPATSRRSPTRTWSGSRRATPGCATLWAAWAPRSRAARSTRSSCSASCSSSRSSTRTTSVRGARASRPTSFSSPSARPVATCAARLRSGPA
jgi:hypothetical protein